MESWYHFEVLTDRRFTDHLGHKWRTVSFYSYSLIWTVCYFRDGLLFAIHGEATQLGGCCEC